MSADPIEEPAYEDSLTLRHRGPWTEADYFALPESNRRIELLDGSLLVSPLADLRHQQIATRLSAELNAAIPRRFEALAGANVRLATGRIVIPDVVVAYDGVDALAADAAAIPLVAEVVSQSSKMMDRLVKPKLYAEAGIPWYLRVERHDGLELTLYRRRDEESCEVYAKAGNGETLPLPAFDCSIEVDALTRRRGRDVSAPSNPSTAAN